MSTLTHDQRERPSLFGPIVLIAIGLFFLVGKLNPMTDLHWGDVLRLWPLFLIFLGLNVLVQQAPRPFGTLLSGLVALLAVGVFGYILIAGVPGTLLGESDLSNWQTEEIAFAADGVTSAVLDIEIGPPGAEIVALNDSRNLIAGTVLVPDGVRFEQEVHNGQATVTLAPHEGEAWVWTPDQWDALDDEARWHLGLSPHVPVSLSLTAAAGSSDFDLRGLTLQDLYLNVAAGEMTVFLPDGDYDAEIETNAAAATIHLPEVGQHQLELRVNAGSVSLYLPAGMEARIEVDQALGGFDDQNGILYRVGDSNVWQTSGYSDKSDHLNLSLHIAVGAVTIR